MPSQPAEIDANQGSHGAYIEASRFRPPGGGVDLPRPRIPWMLGFFSTILLITLWAAWFVLTARSVGLVANPDSASISVEEWPAPRVGNHWLMRKGARRVVVEAPGYTPFKGSIDVTEAQLQTHEIVLVRLPGHLRVNLTPPTEAELFVNGESYSRVPGLISDIPAGHHTIEIRAERYLLFQTELEIEGKGIEQRLDVSLDPAWADVTIDSVPSAVEVRVNKEVVGRTPLTTEILAGRQVVELIMPGFKRWKQTLKIVPGSAVNLGEVVLSKADGHLKVSSVPSAANVTVNGEFHGRTPIEIAVAPDKKHNIELRKEGYQTQQQALTLESGKVTTLALELAPELASIELITLPADAELLIDGESRGNASQKLSLPTHEHEITVRRAGYATYQTRITPRKGVEKRFRIRLKSAAETGQTTTRQQAIASRKGFVKTFAGQEMKLFTGGRATLGSSRRSRGHRANEVLRDVVLERAFYLAVKEISNAEYRLFLAAHRSGEFSKQSLDNDSQAVANISWEGAVLYCNWLSRRDGLPPFYQIKFGEVLGINPDAAGYRLPTEAEWEWASRWPPKGEPTAFSWGDKYPPQGRSGNYADTSAAGIMASTIAEYSDGFAVAAPIGSFTPNLKGLYDMDGNVAEWVHDFYAAAPSTTPARDPLGPRSGVTHVIKGASWAQSSATALRLSYRDFGDNPRDDVGFRLARYAQ